MSEGIDTWLTPLLFISAPAVMILSTAARYAPARRDSFSAEAWPRPSRFSQVMHRQQDLFRRLAEQSIEAGHPVSETTLEQRRVDLFISRAEARSVIANCMEESQRPLNFCPQCGSRLPGHRKA